MDVSQSTVKLAGIAFILSAILTLVVVGMTAGGMSDKSPFERSEVPEFLTDANDNEELLIGAGAIGILNDGFLVLAAGAALYILFRDRNPWLATIALAGIATTAAISLVVDMSNILLTIVAQDYVTGGAGGIAAGDPATLELGRFIGIITFAFTNLLFTPAGVAFLATGLIITSAPQGIINPPKWLGWMAIITGAAMELSWLVVVFDAGFVFFPINLIASLIFLIGLGIWLIRNGDLQPAPMRA